MKFIGKIKNLNIFIDFKSGIIIRKVGKIDLNPERINYMILEFNSVTVKSIDTEYMRSGNIIDQINYVKERRCFSTLCLSLNSWYISPTKHASCDNYCNLDFVNMILNSEEACDFSLIEDILE